MFGPIQRQPELRFSLAGLGLSSGNTQKRGPENGEGYEETEGVNRGNGTDPLNSWKGEGKCPVSQWMRKKKRRRGRETDTRCEMNMEYMYYVFGKHSQHYKTMLSMQRTTRPTRAALFTSSKNYRTKILLRVYQGSIKIKIHSTNSVPVILYGWTEHLRKSGAENVCT